MYKCILPILFLVIIYNSSLAQTEPPTFESGIVQDSIYINSYFNFELSVPKGWIFHNTEKMGTLATKGTDLLAGDDKSLKTALAESLKRTGYLLMATEFATGAPVPLNPTIIIMSEDISAFPGIVTGADYLFHVKAIMAGSQSKIETREIKKINIGSSEFGIMEANVKSVTGTLVKQIYYSTIIKGHSISSIIAYSTDDQYKILESVINSFTSRK
ncbi:MAG: hypothetical protein H7Y07_15455 [Pyrinomonadaceae bacterium]|nr:hypothetical protein [Sphingobacteriaceae bacterium]